MELYCILSHIFCKKGHRVLFTLQPSCANRPRAKSNERVTVHHLLLNFLGKGIVLISRVFHPEAQQNGTHPFLHLAISWGHSAGWSVKSLIWHKGQVDEEEELSFKSHTTAFLPSLSKKDVGWERLGTIPPFRTESDQSTK